MQKRKLKPVVKIVGLSIILFMVGIIILTSGKTKKLVKNNNNDNYTYVNDYIFDNYLPVIKSDELIAKPFNDEGVTIHKKFYEKSEAKEDQQKAIILYENIYMQNSGVDYSSDKAFNVLSSTSGTVVDVSDDELLGKTVEIKNSNGITTIYQSLSEVNVKKTDVISQNQIIGKSGSCNLYKDVKNGLHFEIHINGSIVNPEVYYNKSINEIVSKADEN